MKKKRWAVWTCIWETRMGRDQLGDLSMDENIMLKFILEK
jgi:hypothetical protein